MAKSEKIPTSPQDLLEIQLSIAQAISEVSDPLAIMDQMLKKLESIEGIDAVGVYFGCCEEDEFVLRGNCGLNSDAVTQVAVVENDAWDELDEKLKSRGLKQVVSFPIVANGETRGFLVTASLNTSGLSESIQTLLKTVVANLGGMVVHSNTEAALRTSRYNLCTVFEKFEDYLFVVDEKGRIITCNDSQLGLIGFSHKEILRIPIFRILPDTAALFEQLKHKFGEACPNEKCTIHESNLLDKHNRSIPVEIRISTGKWEDNDVWYVTCRDVSEQIAMEMERDRLAMAIEQTSESVVITDATGSIIYTNSAFTTLTGYSKEEALGANPRILKSGQHNRNFYNQLWETISKGKSWSGRFENTRKDGTNFVEEARISPMRDESGAITHFIGVKRDVSAEVDLERKLRDSQKLEAIGTLAGGIAHDFNNILYAVLGYGQLALDDIPKDHPAHVPVQEICKAGERATDLVDKMLTFGRRADSLREDLDLKPVIEEALGLARASLPSTIEFRIELQEDCPAVLANPNQIHQVIINLCTNAEYALRNTRGTLGISLRECGEKELADTPKFANMPGGKWVCLEISDTGVGMEQAVIDRIFEPYFTTKKAQEGTGFGLATAHGIINSHQGHIYVDSTVGEGTTFTIFLPVSSEEACTTGDLPRTENKNDQSKPDGHGNIMIIDDEQMIVDILCKALPRLGYEVAGFTEGIKALEVFRSSPGAFDLVITDQTMPHITGFEVATELLSIRPDLPIILTTGYADQAGEDHAKSVGISKFVSKPLKISELSGLVKELLGETVQV